MADQAARQVEAAKWAPVEWRVAEEAAADAIRTTLEDAGITGVDVTFVPAK